MLINKFINTHKKRGLCNLCPPLLTSVSNDRFYAVGTAVLNYDKANYGKHLLRMPLVHLSLLSYIFCTRNENPLL